MPDQPPPRRRFQFRLRTLLIGVTLLALPMGYVGWQVKIVRERKAIFKIPQIVAFTVDGEPRLRWIRRCLKDFVCSELPVGDNAAEAELTEYRIALPEATYIGPNRSATRQ